MIKRHTITLFIILLSTLFATSVAVAHPVHQQRIEILSAKITNEPQNSRYLLERGDVYLEENNWALAEADFLNAAKIDPSSGRSDFHFAKLWQFRGDSQKSLQFLDDALKKDENLIAAKLFRTKVFAARAEYNSAAEQLSQIISTTTSPLPDLFLKRDSYFAQDPSSSTQKRIEGLRQGTTLLGPLVVLVSKIVALETESGNFQQAIADIETLPLKLRKHPRWLVKKGHLLSKAGRKTDAKKVYLEANQRISAMPAQRQGTKAIRRLQIELEESSETN